MKWNIDEWLIRWLWITTLGNSLKLASSSRKVIKNISRLIFAILLWMLAQKVNDIQPLIVDYYWVEEKIWEEEKKLMKEQISRITDETTFSDVASVRSNLNLMFSQIYKNEVNFKICKENWVIWLESIEQMEVHIKKLNEENFYNKEIIIHGIHYLLWLWPQLRNYISYSSKECYDNNFSLHSWEQWKIKNFFQEWWYLETSYLMDRTWNSLCNDCHVDDVTLVLSIDINKKAKEIKEKILYIIINDILDIILLLLLSIVLIYQNIKGTKKLNKAKDDTISLAKNIELLIESTPQWLFILWEDWLITYSNQSLLKLLWYYKNEMVWRNIEDFISEKEIKKYKDCNQWNIVCEILLINKEWKEIRVNISWSYIKWDNDDFTLCAFVTDLTQVIDYIKAVMENMKSKEEAIKAKAEAIEAKENFMRTMSHELRTPLNVIMWLLYIVLDTELTNDQRKKLTTAYSSSNHLLELINNILDYSKIKWWKMILEKEPVSINLVVQEVNEMLFEKLSEKKLELGIKVSRNVWYLIWDIVSIKQILINLIWNAIKFTGKWWSININCFLDEWWNNLIIEVQDTWIWISDEACLRIFDDFQQADNSITRNYWWTWLWLTITSGLIDAMWWNIYVESKLWVWSTFIISIPYIQAKMIEKNVKKNILLLHEWWTFETWRKISKTNIWDIKVLLVDDNRLNLMTMRLAMINKLGFSDSNITTKDSWVEAISWSEWVDIIFIDESMSWLSWSEVAGKIREINDKVIIISWSASWDEKYFELIRWSWMDWYLTKPVKVINILPFIKQFQTIK